jgi:hypothetical protein
MPEMAGRPGEREILERTVRAIADRARDAYRLVDEAHDADPRDESGLTAQAKRLRMELLQTKAELERELGRRLLRCRRCNRRVIGSRSRSGARTLELRGAVAPVRCSDGAHRTRLLPQSPRNLVPGNREPQASPAGQPSVPQGRRAIQS